MYQKKSNPLLTILVLLLGGFLIFRIFQKRNQIVKTVKNSRYKSLLPYIEAQARHETGNFTSDLFLRSNNLFGMRNASIRNQLGEQGTNGYRHYKNPNESIMDLLMYFDYVGFPTEVTGVDHYVRELKDRKYFEDSYSNYLKGLKAFL